MYSNRLHLWVVLLVTLALLGCAMPASEGNVATEPVVRQPTQSADHVPRQLPSPWHHLTLRGALPDHPAIQVLHRGALLAPARYRVVLIPGSGCTGFAPFVAMYTRQLLHAEVWVLHKPGVDMWAGAAPATCPAGFVQMDALSAWQQHAQAATEVLLQASTVSTAPPLSTWLVGISEGAEILPSMARGLAASPTPVRLAGMVLVGASGLDPQAAGALQAQRLGAGAAWQALEEAVRSDLPDTQIHQGRSLRYWRDMWVWQVAQPLLQSPLPILQAWGQADALVPAVAYQRFAEQLRQLSPARVAPWCSLSIPDADHGLQTPTMDGVQDVWFALEQWARHGGPAGLAQRWHCTIGGG